VQTAADASDWQIKSRVIQVFLNKCAAEVRLLKTSISIYSRHSKYQLSEETTGQSNHTRTVFFTGFGNHAYSIILECFLLSGVA